MAAPVVNFSVYTGDTHELDVPVTQEDGTSKLDLNGATIKWVIQKSRTSTTYSVYKDTTNGGITITNPTGGIFTIHLASVDTKDLLPGVYYHEAMLIDSSNNVSTIMLGALTLVQNSKNM